MNVTDIGEAIAVRFSSATLTAPAGYLAIQASTHLRQPGGGKTPFCITHFLGLEDLEYATSRRIGRARFMTRFHYSQAADVTATDTGLVLWHDVLIDALNGQLMLGEAATANAVRGAYIRSTVIGLATLGSTDYAVIDFEIDVQFAHAVPFTA